MKRRSPPQSPRLNRLKPIEARCARVRVSSQNPGILHAPSTNNTNVSSMTSPQSRARKIVLVSGATGFVGSHVVHEMLAAGYVVRTIGRKASPGLPQTIEQFV